MVNRRQESKIPQQSRPRLLIAKGSARDDPVRSWGTQECILKIALSEFVKQLFEFQYADAAFTFA